jgi:hypothetical protein
MRGRDGLYVAFVILSSTGVPFSALEAGEPQQPQRSRVTVRDAIEMTQFGGAGYNVGTPAGHSVAQFSPDGKQFVILVRQGDLENNANKYSLLLFKTQEALASPAVDVLAAFSSTSNRPGIQETKWLDNRTVAFLAESPGEAQQLYEVDCDTKRVTRLTDHPTSVVSYAIDPSRDRVFFLTSRKTEPMFSQETYRKGFAVADQAMVELLRDQRLILADRYAALFMEDTKEHKETQIGVSRQIAASAISLAPNGRYLLLKTMSAQFPELWKKYRSRSLTVLTRGEPYQGEGPAVVSRYELLDVATGKSHALLNAPIDLTDSQIAWAADSSFVVISELYLPLDNVAGAALELRESNTFVAEIKIPGGEIGPITSDSLQVTGWDAGAKRVLLEPLDYASEFTVPRSVVYEQVGNRWEKVASTDGFAQDEQPLGITLEEDMNTPPRLYAKDRKTGERALLLDLNPQFRNLAFAKVEDITFKATDGHLVKAGLYRPPYYVAGRRYPLVIQTHAWNPNKFLIDGPWPSGFAAQPLAAHDIVVVQLEEDLSKMSTQAEAREEMAAYEGVIDHLDGLELIDRERVGIIGFSRTGLGVKYALTHSDYHFAAATIADGSDGGYFVYLSVLTSRPIHVPDMEGSNGGVPFGKDLSSWMSNSPGFNLDKVRAAVREEAYGPFSLAGEWEWFAGLSRLRKPVDLIYLPDATHVLIKPWERMTSQQGNVDWFCFWLKGEEYTDPAKREQYERWERLRGLQAGAPQDVAPD